MSARWFGTAKNRDSITHSLAPLTRSLVSYSSLRSRAPLRKLLCSLARSLTPELVVQLKFSSLTFKVFCITGGGERAEASEESVVEMDLN